MCYKIDNKYAKIILNNIMKNKKIHYKEKLKMIIT